MMEHKLDGNAAGGILQEIFPFDMTLVQATCTGCSTTNAAACIHGMGTVLRCPSCENMLIRVAQAKGRYRLDMRGVRVLQISVETSSFFCGSVATV